MSKNFREAFKHIFTKMCSVRKGNSINLKNNNKIISNNNNINNVIQKNEMEMKSLINGENKTNYEIINNNEINQ